MIWQDGERAGRGHMPGVTTLQKALWRLHDQGVLEHVWLKAGGIKPDGSPCLYGTRLVYLPQCRRERRALANRREGATGRMNRRHVFTLEQAKKQIARLGAGPELPTSQEQFERARELARERLRDLEREWSAAPKEKPD